MARSRICWVEVAALEAMKCPVNFDSAFLGYPSIHPHLGLPGPASPTVDFAPWQSSALNWVAVEEVDSSDWWASSCSY